MIGLRVLSANRSLIVGGTVEQSHSFFDMLWGIRAPDGHLYWHWTVEFSVAATITGPAGGVARAVRAQLPRVP